jgi:hypothetical protein
MTSRASDVVVVAAFRLGHGRVGSQDGLTPLRTRTIEKGTGVVDLQEGRSSL